MRVHKRHALVNQAESEMVEALSVIMQKHGLTYGETFQALAGIMAFEAKLMIRQERRQQRRKKPKPPAAPV